MNKVSYGLKRTALTQNSHIVLSVPVRLVEVVDWEKYPCSGPSGSEYFNRNMREGLINIFFQNKLLRVAGPKESSSIDYEYNDGGTLTISVKYYSESISIVGDPQKMADGLYSSMVNKLNSLVSCHFETIIANQRHADVVKKVQFEKSGGDGK